MEVEPILILLVEDDLAHAEIIRRNLEEVTIPNRLVHVQDGQEALDYLYHECKYTDRNRFRQPNLILLDLRMPKVSGLEVLRKIKNEPDLQHIPVVVLTTSAAELDIVAAYQNQVSSYLVKPFDSRKFLKLMQDFGFYWLAWNKFPKQN